MDSQSESNQDPVGLGQTQNMIVIRQHSRYDNIFPKYRSKHSNEAINTVNNQSKIDEGQQKVEIDSMVLRGAARAAFCF